MLNVRQRRSAAAKAEAAELIAELGASRVEELLDAHRTTVARWAAGEIEPPRAVLIALKAALGRLPGMDGRAWDGWSLDRTGRLWSPAGQSWSPGDILAQQYERALIRALQTRVRELEAKLAQAVQGEPAANDGDLSVRLLSQ